MMHNAQNMYGLTQLSQNISCIVRTPFLVLHFLNKKNVHYIRVSMIYIKKVKLREITAILNAYLYSCKI